MVEPDLKSFSYRIPTDRMHFFVILIPLSFNNENFACILKNIGFLILEDLLGVN